MTDIRTPRRNRGLGTVRGLALASVAAVGLAVATSGSASAIDSQNSIVDHGGNTVTATIADTHINFVPPLDGNPLTREFFHNGRAGFKVEGPDADDFEGTVAIGYQIGYPATLDGSISVNYSTPQLELETKLAPDEIASATVSDILPTLGGELSVGFGPGIVDVPATEGDIEGDEGDIALSAFHGSVTGVLGPTNIRPYVTVTSSAGDSVTTYGPIATN